MTNFNFWFSCNNYDVFLICLLKVLYTKHVLSVCSQEFFIVSLFFPFLETFYISLPTLPIYVRARMRPCATHTHAHAHTHLSFEHLSCTTSGRPQFSIFCMVTTAVNISVSSRTRLMSSHLGPSRVRRVPFNSHSQISLLRNR